jgi:hypothetical protein
MLLQVIGISVRQRSQQANELLTPPTETGRTSVHLKLLQRQKDGWVGCIGGDDWVFNIKTGVVNFDCLASAR